MSSDLLKSEIKCETDIQDVEKQENRGRKRKSRWSTAKFFVPGMPTILPSNIDDNQRQAYSLQMEIEEATRKLRQGDFLSTSEAERSPSPEPVYDSNGKRLNTREVRKRQEWELRRHQKIQALLKINPFYRLPADYKAPKIRLHEKVWIPQEDHPEINFVGLLIGPRGNTLRSLEAEAGAKIIIRGKGSIKEGRLSRQGQGQMPGEDEPLHAYIYADNQEAVKKGTEKVQAIITSACIIPREHNELLKIQLRELAVLNGTMRPEDAFGGMRCGNCGSDQHKTWECPDAPNVTANVICSACGSAGHVARDCKNPRSAAQLNGNVDEEYSAFLSVLGEANKNSPTGGAPSPAATNLSYVPRYKISVEPSLSRFEISNSNMPKHFWNSSLPAALVPPPNMMQMQNIMGMSNMMQMPNGQFSIPTPHNAFFGFPPPPPARQKSESDNKNAGILSGSWAPPPPPKSESENKNVGILSRSWAPPPPPK